MSKLYIDQERIQNIVLTELHQVKPEISKVLNDVNRINTPVGRDYQNQCANLLRQSEKELEEVEQMLQRSLRLYAEAINSMNEKVNKIEIYRIKKRVSKIKQ